MEQKNKFKDQSLFSKFILVCFWILVAIVLFWPAVAILAVVLGIIIALVGILFILGIALLPIAAVAWLISRS